MNQQKHTSPPSNLDLTNPFFHSGLRKVFISYGTLLGHGTRLVCLHSNRWLLALFILILFPFNQGLAQEAEVISIHKNDKLKFFHSNYQLRIIDARTDTLHVGYILRGSIGQPIRLRLDAPLTNVLQNIILELPSGKNASNLYLKIIKLQISEFKTPKEVSRCEIIVDFIKEQEGAYTLIAQKSILVSSPIVHIKAFYKRSILHAFQEVLDQFSDNDPTNLNLTINAKYLRAAQKYDAQVYPIQQHQNPTPGLYRNFLEFRNNNPSQTNKYSIDWGRKSTNDKVKVKIRSLIDHFVIRDLWGFSDGTNSYLKIANHYFLLNPSENRDRFDFVLDEFHKNDIPFLMGATMGGVVGGLIVISFGAIARKKNIKDLALNLVTGEVLLSNQQYNQSNPSMDSTQITIIRNTKPKSNSVISIGSGDLEIGRLPSAKSILEFNVPTLYKPLPIIIKHGHIQQEYLIEQITGRNVYILLVEKKSTIAVRQLSREAAGYHFGQIKMYERRNIDMNEKK